MSLPRPVGLSWPCPVPAYNAPDEIIDLNSPSPEPLAPPPLALPPSSAHTHALLAVPLPPPSVFGSASASARALRRITPLDISTNGGAQDAANADAAHAQMDILDGGAAHSLGVFAGTAEATGAASGARGLGLFGHSDILRAEGRSEAARAREVEGGGVAVRRVIERGRRRRRRIEDSGGGARREMSQRLRGYGLELGANGRGESSDEDLLMPTVGGESDAERPVRFSGLVELGRMRVESPGETERDEERARFAMGGGSGSAAAAANHASPSTRDVDRAPAATDHYSVDPTAAPFSLDHIPHMPHRLSDIVQNVSAIQPPRAADREAIRAFHSSNDFLTGSMVARVERRVDLAIQARDRMRRMREDRTSSGLLPSMVARVERRVDLAIQVRDRMRRMREDRTSSGLLPSGTLPAQRTARQPRDLRRSHDYDPASSSARVFRAYTDSMEARVSRVIASAGRSPPTLPVVGMPTPRRPASLPPRPATTTKIKLVVPAAVTSAATGEESTADGESVALVESESKSFNDSDWKVVVEVGRTPLGSDKRTLDVFLECTRGQGAAQGRTRNSEWSAGEMKFTVAASGGVFESEREFCHTFKGGPGVESNDWGGRGFEVGAGDSSVVVEMEVPKTVISVDKTVMKVGREGAGCLCSICMDGTVEQAVVPCGHTFCKECVDKMQNMGTPRGIGGCSVCRGRLEGILRIYL